MYDYGGYNNVCFFAGEVRSPERVIPHSILLSIAAVALLCAGVAPARAEEGPPERLTLQEAVSRALTRNPDVLTAAAEVRRAEGLVMQVRASSLPTKAKSPGPAALFAAICGSPRSFGKAAPCSMSFWRRSKRSSRTRFTERARLELSA